MFEERPRAARQLKDATEISLLIVDRLQQPISSLPGRVHRAFPRPVKLVNAGLHPLDGMCQLSVETAEPFGDRDAFGTPRRRRVIGEHAGGDSPDVGDNELDNVPICA